MSAEAVVQPTLDLGEYRDKQITATKVKLANANDGFDPSTTMEEPRIYEIGETLTLAVRVIVTAHTAKLLDLDDGGKVELLQTFKAGTMAVVSDKLVAKELNAVEKLQAAAKAKKPVKRRNLRAVTTEGPKAVGASLQEALQQA